MCFRPVSVGGIKKCEACGATNPSIAKNCIKCKVPLKDPEPEPIECPRCGARNPANATACSNCGLTAQQAMAANRPTKCPECGILNPAGIKTCKKCSAALPMPWD
jgi:ribosomal protein L40E